MPELTCPRSSMSTAANPERISGCESTIRSACCMRRSMASSEVPTGASIEIMKEDMSSAGANSAPMNGVRKRLATKIALAPTRVATLCRSTQSRPRA